MCSAMWKFWCWDFAKLFKNCWEFAEHKIFTLLSTYCNSTEQLLRVSANLSRLSMCSAIPKYAQYSFRIHISSSACAQQNLSINSALIVMSQHMLSNVLLMLVDGFGNWIDSFSEANILWTPLSVSLMILGKKASKIGCTLEAVIQRIEAETPLNSLC